MLTLKKVKELVEAPSHAKRTPSPKMLFEEGIVLLRREFDQGSHLTVYNSGYVLFSAGKRNTVFHIHDCQGDYAYDAAEGKGDVIQEEYFENCEWHIRALFEGERKMEDRQKILENKQRNEERKARTRRLIERGAVLEGIFPLAPDLPGVEVKAFLIALSHLPGAAELTANLPKSGDTP